MATRHNARMINAHLECNRRSGWCAALCPSLAILSLAFTVLLPLPALAWNAAGHRLVACIAWDHLDQQTRSEVATLLREHPDYPRWIKRARDAAPDRAAFIEASTWADEIRNDARFYNANEDVPTPTQPGFPDMERRRSWHYVNRPLNDSPPGYRETGLLEQQLTALTKAIGSTETTKSEHIYDLPWLIHLTGDAHQPLHASIRLDADGHWDKLGNGMTVINPFISRKQQSSLHAFWDDLPGPPWLRGTRLDSACEALTALYPRPRTASPIRWIDESWQIARTKAYPPGDESVPTISAAFYEDAREIANRRVAEAGYRLADLLYKQFDKK